MVLKLYAVSDGPSSLSVRQALKVLDIPFDLTNVDYGAGEHMTPEYAMMNPQKEIPVLEDDGFYLGESNAILQYLCDKYRPQSELLYPQEPRARTELGLKKVHIALDVLETYLQKLGARYVAGDNLTIADFQLFNSTMTLEAIDFDFSQYKK
ncbi:unnamed protein product, partial [Leptidea sinapis]